MGTRKFFHTYILFRRFSRCRCRCDCGNSLMGHGILLEKLLRRDVCGPELAWFTDYLFQRNQTVELNNNSSMSNNVTTEVPKGSILGPLLFMIFFQWSTRRSRKVLCSAICRWYCYILWSKIFNQLPKCERDFLLTEWLLTRYILETPFALFTFLLTRLCILEYF